MFLVHGLPRDAEHVGDGLPRHAPGSRVVHVGHLELFHEAPERGHGAQTDSGIAAIELPSQLLQLVRHVVSLS